MNALLRLGMFAGVVGVGAFLLVAAAAPVAETSVVTAEGSEADLLMSKEATAGQTDELADIAGETIADEANGAAGDGKEVKDPKDGKTFLEPDGKESKEVLDPIGEGPGDPRALWIVTGPSAGGGPAILPPMIQGARVSESRVPPVVEAPDLPETNDDVFTRR